MMIRRGGVTDIPWFLAGLEIECPYLFNTSCIVIMVSAISQLGMLASHKTNFVSVAQGAWELDMLPFGRCHFLSDHLLRKKCL